MVTALIIANIALTVALMTTVKQVKNINKGIEDIGSNLAQIQKNNIEIGVKISDIKRSTLQIWHMNTNIIELVGELHDMVDNNSKVLEKSINGPIKSLTEEFTKEIESISLNLSRVEQRNVEISNSIAQSKNDITKEFNSVHKMAIAYPSPLVFLKNK